MTTQRHFQKLAYELMLVRPDHDLFAFGTWTAATVAVANACAQSNPSFNRDRFYRACNAQRYTPSEHGR